MHLKLMLLPFGGYAYKHLLTLPEETARIEKTSTLHLHLTAHILGALDFKHASYPLLYIVISDTRHNVFTLSETFYFLPSPVMAYLKKCK